MLVFGIATAVTTIHRVLPHAVSSVLAIERFQSQPSHICVLEIINKVILNYYILVRIKMPSYTKNKLSVKSELSLKSVRKEINFNKGLCVAIKFSFSPLV